jgi:hypothetical protein
MSDKVVWWAVREAARRADITRKTWLHSFARERLEARTQSWSTIDFPVGGIVP